MAGVSLILTGCSHDSALPEEPKEDEMIFVAFTLTMNRLPSATRADGDYTSDPFDTGDQTWGNTYDSMTGDEFESTLTNISPLLYKVDADNTITDDQPIGKVFVMGQSVINQGTQSVVYRVQGLLIPTDGTTNFLHSTEKYRLVITANFEDAGTGSLSGKTFNLFGKPSETFKAIPMWGVSDISLAGINEGETYELPNEISLLRSMAKIEVNLDLPAEQKGRVELVSLTLSNYQTAGYLVPKNWSAVASTKELKLASDTFNPITIAGATNLVVNSTTENTESIFFYIPETQNADGKYAADGSSNDIKLKVKYRLDKVEEKEGTIHFCLYQDGLPKPGSDLWDIVRNHIYEYTITGVQDSKISVEAKVKDWQYHKNTHDLE